MKAPKVSIIIPLYNAASSIGRCAVSLFEQSLTNLEYIFVDDCSTDTSLEQLREIIKSYPQRKDAIKIISHSENRGSATARNTGLKHATGEYIGWVDADDWIAVDMYEVLYKKTLARDLDLVSCSFKKVFSEKKIEVKQIDFNTNELFIKALIRNEVQGMLWNKIIRRSIIEKENIRFLEGNDLGEDRCFLIKVLFYTNSIDSVNESLYYYDQRSEISITRDPNVRRVYEEINNTADNVRFFRENNIEWLSESEIKKFQFRAKSKLLYSCDIQDFKNWKTVFPESNIYFFSSSLRIRHKILSLLSIYNLWFLIKGWTFLKKSINKV